MYVDEAGAVIGTDIVTGHVYAFAAATGDVTWKIPVASGVGTDIVGHATAVVALGHAGELLSIDRTTGAVRWTFQVPESHRSKGIDDPSPATDGTRVFVPGRDRRVHALDAATGRPLWSTRLGGKPTTSILVRHDELFVGTTDRKLYRLDPDTGAVRGAVELEFVPRDDIVATDDALVLRVRSRSGETAIAAVAADLSERLWNRPPPDGSVWSTSRPYIRGPIVVTGTAEGQVTGLRLADGTTAWTLEPGGVIKVIGGDSGLLLVGTQEGTLHGLSWP